MDRSPVRVTQATFSVFITRCQWRLLCNIQLSEWLVHEADNDSLLAWAYYPKHMLCTTSQFTAILAGAMTILCGCESTGPRLSRPLPTDHPRTYVAGFASTPPAIDGKVDDRAWRQAPWTQNFVDIEGSRKPTPEFQTRAKMCWDTENFYVVATLEEPHLWGTLTERDSIIYHDNDFEVFIDPNGDRHTYNEYEINVLGTEMDLYMGRPYRSGGHFDLAWDFDGVRSAVRHSGTINDPSDRDKGWTVEIAIPWTSMADTAGVGCPPGNQDTWWVNFSRVQWPYEIVDGRYVKPKGAREDNWVWSPQDAIDMHRPEYWGLVQFSTSQPGDIRFVVPDDVAVRAQLRDLIAADEKYSASHGSPPKTIADLDGLWKPNPDLPMPRFRAGERGRLLVQEYRGQQWVVDARGRIHGPRSYQ